MYQPFQRAIITNACLLVLVQLLALISPYLVGATLNMVYRKEPFMLIAEMIGLMVVFGFVNSLAGYFQEKYLLQKINFTIDNHIQGLTLNKLFQLSISQHRNQSSNLTRTVINRGESNLRELMDLTVYNLIPISLQMLVTMIALLVINWQAGLVLVLGVSLTLIIGWFINKHLWPRIKAINDLFNDDGKVRNEIFSALSIIMTYAQEQKMSHRYSKRVHKSSVEAITLWSEYIFLAYLRDLVQMFLRPGVLLLVAWQVYAGKYEPGHLVIVLMWTNYALNNISWLPHFQRRVMRGWAPIKNYLAIFEMETNVPLPDPGVYINDLKHSIKLENVSYSYPVGQKDHYVKGEVTADLPKEPMVVLSDIDLTIEVGEKVALVGESGSGKSTLVNLLIRSADPDSGRILIDGQDLRELNLESWLHLIGSVEQDVCLFDTSVRENLVFGLNGKAETITDEELMEVVELARIDQFWDRLEDGLETEIGEKGVKLSGGERQRMGIARAIIKNPAILIFDEATSHLDSRNEQLIQSAVDDAIKGRTAVFIAHRLSTIRDADKIVVMQKGRIISVGKHDELMNSCDVYQELVLAQRL